jgi:hypothetical protein
VENKVEKKLKNLRVKGFALNSRLVYLDFILCLSIYIFLQCWGLNLGPCVC